ncbi:EamA family transporter [Streptomyces pathocidini]|uniref:DMT family transporter n=1 Tax=Streptomyces pathocidini TaxID=1650571 RepID=UPI0033C2EFED
MAREDFQLSGEGARFSGEDARFGGIVQVLAAAALWGTVGPAQLIAHADVSLVSLGACRMLLGGAVLGLFTVRAAGLRTLWRPATRWWMLAGVLVTAAFQVCFLEAVDRTGAALATAVTFGTVPVITGLCAWWFERERASVAGWCGTACSLAGIGVLLVPDAAAQVDVTGVLLGIASGSSFGTYIAATQQLARRGADATAAASMSVLCAGVLLSPWLFVAPGGLGAPRAVLLISWLALGTTALGYLLFARGVTRISAATAGTLSLGEPLVAAVLGVALLGERPGAVAACGAALLLAGLIAVSLPARGRTTQGGTAPGGKEPAVAASGGSRAAKAGSRRGTSKAAPRRPRRRP